MLSRRDQVAVDAARLAADQLGDVRVLLLGHDGGAGGEGVVQLDELELPAAPQDDLLARSGTGASSQWTGRGSSMQKSRSETPSRLLRRGAAKPSASRAHGPVERIGGAGQSAGSQRARRPCGRRSPRAAPRRAEHGGIGHQMLAKGDGLRALQMGVAGHHGGLVVLRPSCRAPRSDPRSALEHAASAPAGTGG